MTETLTTSIPLLRDGERLSRDEFERRYEAMPDIKAELMDGVVYMASPTKTPHSRPHFDLIGWLGSYCMQTPGVEGYDNGTLRLPSPCSA